MSGNLFILIFPHRRAAISNDVIPAPTSEDISLFIRLGATKGATPTFLAHSQDTNPSYQRMKFTDTLYNAGVAITAEHFREIEQLAEKFVIYNYVAGLDIGPFIVAALVHVVSKSGVEDPATPHIDKLGEVFEKGGTFTGRLLGTDGTMSPLGPHTYAPAAGAVEIDFETDTQEGILTLIETVVPAIAYDGFNPKHIRSIFISKHNDQKVVAKNLLLVFAAYAFIGNNITKLTVRRVDAAIGDTLMKMVTSLGVKKVDRSKNGLTLPRLAIAFMPEYLAFRRFISKELQNQTSSSVSVEFKDIAFYGCDQVRNKGGYLEFHKEFSSYIYKQGKDVSLEDPGFLKNYARWNKVAIQGYQKDTTIHQRMIEIVGSEAMTRAQVYDFFITGITVTYKN